MGQHFHEMFAISTTSRHIRNPLKNQKPAFPRDPHVFIGALGRAWKPQDSVASTKQPMGNGIKNLLLDCIPWADGPSLAKQR
jgi:hypothetical protein